MLIAPGITSVDLFRALFWIRGGEITGPAALARAEGWNPQKARKIMAYLEETGRAFYAYDTNTWRAETSRAEVAP